MMLFVSRITRSQGFRKEFQRGLSIPKQKKKIWYDCTKTSNIPRPIKGNAILFFTRHSDASPDTSSGQARCPLDGDMWYALKLFFVSTADGERSQLNQVAVIALMRMTIASSGPLSKNAKEAYVYDGFP